MSRITARPTTGSLNPFGTAPANPNLSSSLTSTPVNQAQAYSAIPPSGSQPSSGTGVFDPNAGTYVGQKFDTSDGRELVFIQNGAVALATAKVVQSCPEVTAFQKLAMTVPTATPATAGTFQILVTNGGTKLNFNQFQQGYAIVASGTGIGQQFKIANHPNAAASATCLITLEDPIKTTLDATSTISLLPNPYIGSVIQVASGSTQTGSPIGITIAPIAASVAATFDGTSGAQTANGTAQYGLIQSHGPVAGTLTTGGVSLTTGSGLGISTTAGNLIVQTLTTAPLIAYNMQTQTDAQSGLVFLNL